MTWRRDKGCAPAALGFGASGHSRDAPLPRSTGNGDPARRPRSSAILEKKVKTGGGSAVDARKTLLLRMMGVRSIISSLPEWSLLMAAF